MKTSYRILGLLIAALAIASAEEATGLEDFIGLLESRREVLAGLREQEDYEGYVQVRRALTEEWLHLSTEWENSEPDVIRINHTFMLLYGNAPLELRDQQSQEVWADFIMRILDGSRCRLSMEVLDAQVNYPWAAAALSNDEEKERRRVYVTGLLRSYAYLLNIQMSTDEQLRDRLFNGDVQDVERLRARSAGYMWALMGNIESISAWKSDGSDLIARYLLVSKDGGSARFERPASNDPAGRQPDPNGTTAGAASTTVDPAIERFQDLSNKMFETRPGDWIAWLESEVSYGPDETLGDVAAVQLAGSLPYIPSRAVHDRFVDFSDLEQGHVDSLRDALLQQVLAGADQWDEVFRNLIDTSLSRMAEGAAEPWHGYPLHHYLGVSAVPVEDGERETYLLRLQAHWDEVRGELSSHWLVMDLPPVPPGVEAMSLELPWQINPIDLLPFAYPAVVPAMERLQSLLRPAREDIDEAAVIRELETIRSELESEGAEAFPRMLQRHPQLETLYREFDRL